MFIRSAAMDTLQGKAIQAVNEKWGEDFRQWGGRENIGFPVCKKKYAPFTFTIVPAEDVHQDKAVDSEEDQGRREYDGEASRDESLSLGGNSKRRQLNGGKVEVKIERMYGCVCHHHLRKAVIEQHGLRRGWEPFGQWSLRKAQELARRETERLNQPRANRPLSLEGDTSEEGWTSSDGEEKLLPTMCNNGSFTWKIKTKFDDIYAEIHGHSESDIE